MMMTMASCGDSAVTTSADEPPVVMLRFRSTNTESDEQWEKTFGILRDNPGCCDEVWFSTGLGVPPMAWHQEQADRIARGAKQLEEIGIQSSLQVQMTLGHGDSFAAGQEWRFSEKNWKGFTGSTGVEDKYCNCPRQPAFLEYMRQMTLIYAATKPRIMWIDDDLRHHNHVPATNGSRIGCWCDTCIAAFNAEQGTEWTRETLNKAMDGNSSLEEAWQRFSVQSLVMVARIIAEATHEVSPATKMGFQSTFDYWNKDVAAAVLTVMQEVTGNKVAYRPGGGAYYDIASANDQVIKSMGTAQFLKIMGDPDYVDTWCPEIESWPRVYGSRTPQAVLVEGFTALAYGLNAVSMFIMAADQEDDSIYSYALLKPIAEGNKTLKGYAKANEGTEAVGYEMEGSMAGMFAFGRAGIPMLPGLGKSLGKISKTESARLDITQQLSTDIQSLREEINGRSPSPVVCCSPFDGLVIPRVDKETGVLRTIGLLNTRVDTQGPIRLRLDGLSTDIRTATWYQMKQKPVKLKIKREKDTAFVEIPELTIWNVGYLLME